MFDAIRKPEGRIVDTEISTTMFTCPNRLLVDSGMLACLEPRIYELFSSTDKRYQFTLFALHLCTGPLRREQYSP